jgi:hypothetical protein
VKAWPEVIERHPELDWYSWAQTSNPMVPQHSIVDQTLRLAEEIGEKDRSIIFLDWVTYEDREAICASQMSAFHFTPGILKRIIRSGHEFLITLAKLLVLVSDGDVVSEWVQKYRLGSPHLRRYHCRKGKFDQLLDEPNIVSDQSYEKLRSDFTWDNVVQPLRRYCHHGSHAPDRSDTRNSILIEVNGQQCIHYSPSRFHLAERGGQVLLQRVWKYCQWRLSSLK